MRSGSRRLRGQPPQDPHYAIIDPQLLCLGHCWIGLSKIVECHQLHQVPIAYASVLIALSYSQPDRYQNLVPHISEPSLKRC